MKFRIPSTELSAKNAKWRDRISKFRVQLALGPESRIRSAESEIRNSEFRVQCSESRAQNPKVYSLVFNTNVQSAELKDIIGQNPESTIQNAKVLSLEFRDQSPSRREQKSQPRIQSL